MREVIPSIWAIWKDRMRELRVCVWWVKREKESDRDGMKDEEAEGERGDNLFSCKIERVLWKQWGV